MRPAASSKTPSNPFVTPRGAEEKLGLAYNTVMRAVGILREQGIVTAATEAKRGRVFCAKAILDILEEPARLTPVVLVGGRDRT
jgi:DNA-binding transcriptional ArsR family regulator